MANLTLVQAINLALIQEMEEDDRDHPPRRGRRPERRRLPRHRRAVPAVRRATASSTRRSRSRASSARRSAWRWPACVRFPRSSSRASSVRRTTRSARTPRGCARAPAARCTVPLTVRVPVGGGIHAPELHSDSPEAIYAHTAGPQGGHARVALRREGPAHLGHPRSRSGDLLRAQAHLPRLPRRGAGGRVHDPHRRGPRRVRGRRADDGLLGRVGHPVHECDREVRSLDRADRPAHDLSARHGARSPSRSRRPAARSSCTRRRRPRASARRSRPASWSSASCTSRRRSSGSPASTRSCRTTSWSWSTCRTRSGSARPSRRSMAVLRQRSRPPRNEFTMAIKQPGQVALHPPRSGRRRARGRAHQLARQARRDGRRAPDARGDGNRQGPGRGAEPVGGRDPGAARQGGRDPQRRQHARVATSRPAHRHPVRRQAGMPAPLPRPRSRPTPRATDATRMPAPSSARLMRR